MISSTIRKVTGGATTNTVGVSGTLTEGSMRKIWALMGHKAHDKCFYDIGASVGNAVFFAALHGARHSTGCELPENEFLSHFFEAVKRRLIAHEHNQRIKLSLQTASITFEAFHTIPPDSNIVFTFNKGFDTDTQYQIMSQVASHPNVQIFICCKNPAFTTPDHVLAELNGNFHLIGQVKATMAGSRETIPVWLFERK